MFLMYTNRLFYKICPHVLPNSKGNDTTLQILVQHYKEKIQM